MNKETYPIVNCLNCGHPQPLLDENILHDELGNHVVCEECESSFDVDSAQEFKMKDEVERVLINMFATIGIDIPINYEDIVQYCYEDVMECADKENWHSGDVAISFRRWIEEQSSK